MRKRAEVYQDSGVNLLAQIHLFAPPEARTRPIMHISEYEKLIEDNADIVQALESAIESDHYEEVLSMPALTGEDHNTSAENYGPLNIDSATPIAWKAKYQGKYHEVILKNINSMCCAPVHASSAAVIQSSGTGKSRTVHELAALVFTIPFNIRHPREREWGAYPPEDTKIWGYLCNMSNIKSVEHGIARTALFFTHVFSQVANEVKKVLRISGRENKLHPGDLAYRWREHLSQKTRSLLYEQIINACEEAEPGRDADLHTLFHESDKQLNELLKALDTVCAFPNLHDVKVLLYFDEAHELGYTIPNRTYKQKLYDVVDSCLQRFEHYPIFTLFLSTQSPIGPLAPSAELVGSTQQWGMETLQACFTEMPFDCHPSFPLRPGTFKLEELGELPFLARFGRPLFWTLIEASRARDKSYLIQDTMNLARAKLIRTNDIVGTTFSPLAMLVMVDVLITIDYEPRQDSAHACQLEMVASQMRIAFSAPQHRPYPARDIRLNRSLQRPHHAKCTTA